MLMPSLLATKVYNILLKKILDNTLSAGEFINRREIAKQLNVSVAPVLEAMVLLENDGLLESIPRKGTRVCIIRDSDIMGNLFIREALECTAARIICGKLISEQFDNLLPLAQEADKASLSSLEYFRADINFHRALINLCGSDVINEEYARVTNLGLFYSINKFVSLGDAMVRLSHESLLKQLVAAEPDEAQHIMRQHIISGKGHLVITR